MQSSFTLTLFGISFQTKQRENKQYQKRYMDTECDND